MNTEQRIDYYLELAGKYPEIFDNSSGELKIILDREQLLLEQKKLYDAAREKRQPEYWFDIGVLSEDLWTITMRDLVVFRDGTCGGYIRMINRSSQLLKNGRDVVIFVLRKEKILISRHFRHEDRAWHWECPRGFGEHFLTSEENARKELKEETGLFIQYMEQLNPIKEPVSYFAARCQGEIQCSDKNEAITKSKFVTMDEFETMILNGSIDDKFTLRAYALAKLKRIIE